MRHCIFKLQDNTAKSTTATHPPGMPVALREAITDKDIATCVQLSGLAWPQLQYIEVRRQAGMHKEGPPPAARSKHPGASTPPTICLSSCANQIPQLISAPHDGGHGCCCHSAAAAAAAVVARLPAAPGRLTTPLVWARCCLPLPHSGGVPACSTTCVGRQATTAHTHVLCVASSTMHHKATCSNPVNSPPNTKSLPQTNSLCVQPALRQQLCVCAPLCHQSLLEHHNQVRLSNRAQPVRNNKGGAVAAPL